MKPAPFLLFTVLLASFHLKGQMISRFLWSSTPLTTAAQGPSGTSVSSSATSSYIGGSLGYALNPGLPTQNVNLIIPGSPYFDVSSIYIDLHFRREENQASFFRRGALFDFGMNGGNLYIIFTTTQGSTPGNLTINSGTIAAVADDHTFHRYRFAYDNNTGVARVWVDNNIVYTYNGVAGRPLAWTSAGDVIVGGNMDASGRNIAVLSNFSVQHYSAAVLADHPLNFNTVTQGNILKLQWQTTAENLSDFIIEKSENGADYREAGICRPQYPSGSINSFYLDDNILLPGGNMYFRLKIVHENGGTIYSRSIKVHKNSRVSPITCYPNPASQFVKISLFSSINTLYSYSIFTREGVSCLTGQLNVREGQNELKISLDKTTVKGNLFIQLHSATTGEIFQTTFMRL